MKARHPVSDTAALVMLWASEYYRRNPLTHAFLERLDLSSGQALFDQSNTICPWYSEVIVNRKHFICNEVRNLIGRPSGKTVIVNLGAGFSPIALELASRLSPRCRFVEMDEHGMDRKYSIYTDLVPDQSRFISCHETDITDTSTLHDILEPEAPCHLIVLMEGLTYYLPRKVLENIVVSFTDLFPALSLVIEYVKPCLSITIDRRDIPCRIFSLIRDYTGVDRMTTYTGEEIRAMLPENFSLLYFDMDTMEERRTGSRKYFPSPDSGWISCAVAIPKDV